MPQDAFSPAIIQRTSRELLFKIRKDKALYILDGSHAIFVLKDKLETPDTEALLVKRSSAWPGPSGNPGDDSEIEYVDLPPPNGGDDVTWGLKVKILAEDLGVAFTPGEYFIQIDVIPPSPADQRFTPVQGFITVKETGIQTL